MENYQQLRTAAKRVGLIIKKSYRKIKTENNLCGYMLVDGKRRSCVQGSRWELTAGDVLRFCETESVTS